MARHQGRRLLHEYVVLLEPVLDELVVTQNSSARALDVDELAALAVEVFGVDRVTVVSSLDDAIDFLRRGEPDAAARIAGRLASRPVPA